MKRKTIRDYKDFITAHDALCARTMYGWIKTKNAKFPKDPRYGIVASKRVFKTAVERNRAKRLLRDWICYNENLMLDEFDYIFIANKDILSATRDQGRHVIQRAFRRMNRYHRLDVKNKQNLH